MEGFATACRRWESIDGELDHNDCYRPTDQEHDDGGLIPVNGYIFCLLCGDQIKDAYSKIGSYSQYQSMLWISFVGAAKHGTMKNIIGSGCF